VLAGIADFRPEVAVLDLGLPDLAGLEVARRVRAELGPQLTLVALTGFGNADDRAASRLAGFDHHRVKPAPREELLRIIRNASRGCRRPS
jgi:two-component system CheB/CheR fusion protein